MGEATSTNTVKQEQPTVFTPEYYLLKGPMPDLSKMNKNELKSECELWRRLWAWVPDRQVEIAFGDFSMPWKKLSITLRGQASY
jgi:hypothetical protein